MNAVDVVVVGGRLAGAATALQLARGGARVVVLERGRYGSDTVSTHALMRTGVVQLNRWNLLDRLQRTGTPPVRTIVFHYASGDVPVALRPAAGVDALYAPRRTTLDTLLVDAAADAGADIRHGVPVTGLLRDRHGGVSGVRTHDGEVRARLTVGADGLRSAVAGWVAAPYERRGSAASAVVYGYWAGLGSDGYEWAYGEHAAAGVIPTDDGQVLVFAATDARRFRAMPGAAPGRFTQLLVEASPALAARVADARLVGRLRGFGGVPGYLRRPSGPGWALVGDAGYFKDPISAHGMSDALRDAELLARAILAARGGGAEAMGAYRRERNRVSAALFEVTEQIAGYAWDEARIRSLNRELSAAMGDEVEALLALDDPDSAVA